MLMHWCEMCEARTRDRRLTPPSPADAICRMIPLPCSSTAQKYGSALSQSRLYIATYALSYTLAVNPARLSPGVQSYHIRPSAQVQFCSVRVSRSLSLNALVPAHIRARINNLPHKPTCNLPITPQSSTSPPVQPSKPSGNIITRHSQVSLHIALPHRPHHGHL